MNHRQTRSPTPRVLVIGGGVAGTSCALRLRTHGIEVDLAEKSRFPRAKVCGCCIGGAGLQMLQRLEILDTVQQLGVGTESWLGSIAGQRIELPLPSGIAISREALDTLLLQAAGEAGTNVFNPASAKIEQVGDNSVTALIEFDDESMRHQYDAVVVASGLNATGSNRLLPWQEKPNGPFGVSFFGRSERLTRGVIYMACDDDGYVGLVQLEDGRIDVAAALATGVDPSGGGSAMERVESILSRSELHECVYECTSAVMTTPPLRRRRKAGVARVIAIGDAAGYVEPFTGEGMTWGMMSALSAADTIAELAGDLQSLGNQWNRRHATLLRSKRVACRAVTSALRSPLARRAVAATLAQWPSVATPLIQHLNRV